MKRGLTAAGLALIGMLSGLPESAGSTQTQTLTIAAAQSLKPALREILSIFESQYRQADVRVVYGPSQTLRQQIEDGAPADVFLPASVEEVEALHKKGLTLNGSPQIYAQTSLVLATGSPAYAKAVFFENMHSQLVSRIAVGDPKTTSLGRLTDRLLSQLNLGPKPASRYLYRKHDEVIDLLNSGEADVGIVYRVDVAANPKLRIIDEVPGGIHIPVVFAEAVVWTCRHSSCELAREFTNFMHTPSVQKVLQKHGFDPVSSDAYQIEARRQ
ncbi:MAG: molybdate ABC transporter substrate-binding protein [Nitrospiraceae bacterium]